MRNVVVTETCWLRTTSISANGYVTMKIGGKQRYYAHRVIWEVEFGPIPPGMQVCHHCDVRNCVRPDHLFLGTLADNMADMVAKGRSNRGAKNGQAKLAAADVKAIREAVAVGPRRTRTLMSQKYGVTQGTITSIVQRRLWRHV